VIERAVVNGRDEMGMKKTIPLHKVLFPGFGRLEFMVPFTDLSFYEIHRILLAIATTAPLKTTCAY
jgi:hypothetical protein